uniref:Lipocalin n=1 Tax=Angiostrongylus cantonensis TaxID=6313 RepID=A0A0K0D614_ANGCA
MRLASDTMLEQDYHHGLRLREKGTNGICAGVRTTREDGQPKCPSKTNNPNRTFTIFVVYEPSSNCDEEEVEAFDMDLEKFYREDHTFFKVFIGDACD